MKQFLSSIARIGLVLAFSAAGVHGQTPAPQTQTVVAPTLIRMSGALKTPTGQPRTGTVVLVASLYSAQTDPVPLWSEFQTVTLDENGAFSILVGATLEGGVPAEYFRNGAGRWLGVGVQNEAEQPRVVLISVPYALKAADADTLSGKSAADFVLSSTLSTDVKAAIKSQSIAPLAISSTVNSIAKFTDTVGTVGNSNIFTSSDGTKVGVGTSSPVAPLQVIGLTGAYGTTTGTGFMLSGGAANVTPEIYSDYLSGNEVGLHMSSFSGRGTSAGITISPAGRVGIGTNAPAAPLQVIGLMGAYGATNGTGFMLSGGAANQTPEIFSDYISGSEVGLHMTSFSGRGTAKGLTLTPAGNVGIGTINPVAALDVVGSINVSGNINAKYQDVAEWVETSAPLEAGTVVIVDPKSSNRVLASPKAYDTRVAGAVSAKPGLLLGEGADNKAMVAQSGRVRVKVDASYGAIKVGDLLVTSPTPGYAMRSKPVLINGVWVHRAGTLLGKALEARAKGKGEILVLLTLQ